MRRSVAAFVADGSSANWGVWERHFSNFTPIVDFIHALSYVFQAAMAGRSFALGWEAYTDWIHALWAGQVERVIAGLTQRQVDLGVPTAEETETSPKMRVAEALTYLQNQRTHALRRVPQTRLAHYVEPHRIDDQADQSRRVKGTEKFWSSMGAEAILQLRADAKQRRSTPSGNDDKKRQRDSDATKSQGNYRPCRTPRFYCPFPGTPVRRVGCEGFGCSKFRLSPPTLTIFGAGLLGAQEQKGAAARGNKEMGQAFRLTGESNPSESGSQSVKQPDGRTVNKPTRRINLQVQAYNIRPYPCVAW